MLYLTRRRDFQLLASPPVTRELPKSKIEQAQKEIVAFKKQPKPKSHNQLVKHNSELYYLEQRLLQIRSEVEAEQKSYYLSSKEREIAWKDYQQYFNNLNVVERFFAIGKLKELAILRKLYLEAEKRVDLELSKFSAQSRIRYHEEKTVKEREDEIKEKTQSTPDGLPTDLSEEIETEEGGTEIQVRSAGSDNFETLDDNEAFLDEMTPGSSPSFDAPVLDNTFGQEDFKIRYPDFKGCSYIDDSFSMKEIGYNVVRDATFDDAFFVSVTFEDRNQFKDCTFVRTDFSYSIWKSSDEPHRILSCQFQSSKFNFSQISRLAFYNCTFEGTDFTSAQMTAVKFVNCKFQNCILDDVDFSRTVMSLDMLETIDFSNCIAPPKNFRNEQIDGHSVTNAEKTSEPDVGNATELDNSFQNED